MLVVYKKEMVGRFEDRDFLKTANQILDNNYLPLDLSVKD